MRAKFDYGLWKHLHKARMTLRQMHEHVGFAVYDVEPELVKLAHCNTQLLMNRYKEGIPRDWKPSDKKSMLIGLLGEQIFDVTLYQLRIPHLYTHPLYPHELRTPHDFHVDGKTIQVKTVRFETNYKNLTVKIAEWSKSDFVVPIKLIGEDLKLAHIIGYLTRSEVENLDVAENDYPCPYASCYWCPLEEVTKKHSALDLFNLLKQRSF